MKKFILTCNMDRLVLSDFDVVLVKGEELSLTEVQIASSPDLLTALRHGGLTVRKKSQIKTKAQSSRIRPKTKRVRRIKKTNVPDLEDRLKMMIADTLEQKLGQVLRAVENQPQPTPVTQPLTNTVEIDAEMMLAAVKEALSGVQTVVASSQPVASSGSNIPLDDTPMFIPTGIVGSELAAEIDTEQESSKGSSVDAATEALRLLRKSKKNKES